MNYNLLEERWIPVRRASGRRDWIAPWQIAEGDDPAIEVASVRSDFDGALLQFLIGLLQTVSAPKDEAAWRRRLGNPELDGLRAECDTARAAFNLFGDGPRFMQESSLLGEEPTELTPDRLLLDFPGEKTLEENADVFVKRTVGRPFGLPSVVTALVSLQLNAPSGGSGIRTSLRGGGPLSTIILGETLWETAWFNVLPEADFLDRGGNPGLREPSAVFPWLGKPNNSAKGEETGPTKIHPAQQYWATPRRVLLDAPIAEGRCALTGLVGPVVERLWMKRHGVNYKGAFEHPLTPYVETKDGGAPVSRKLNTDGLPYRDWPAHLFGREKLRPARVVTHALVRRRLGVNRGQVTRPVRLLAFGYSMDNAKAEAWFAGVAPVYAVAEGADRFRARVGQAAAVAEEVRRTLITAVIEATKRRTDDVKDKFGNALSTSIGRRFWAESEVDFFATVEDLHRLCESGEEESAIEARIVAWIKTLQRSARSIFEDLSQERGEFAAADVKRVSLAWNTLLARTSLQNQRVLEAAGLPLPAGDAGKNKRKK